MTNLRAAGAIANEDPKLQKAHNIMNSPGTLNQLNMAFSEVRIVSGTMAENQANSWTVQCASADDFLRKIIQKTASPDCIASKLLSRSIPD